METTIIPTGNSVEGRYSSLESNREPYLTRAKEASRLTIPHVLPEHPYSISQDLPTPYQSVGARGVNHLTNKLLITLLPPNQPFFRYIVDDFTIEALSGKPDQRAEIEEALNQIERGVTMEIGRRFFRVGVASALRHLIVTGNVLLHIPDKGRMRVFRLDKYVVRRSPDGEVQEIIVKEAVLPADLPAEISGEVEEKLHGNNEKTADLYTIIRRHGNMWHVEQEAQGVFVPGSEGSYPLDKSPWMALRWNDTDGEDYGRGHVEEYLGDLKSLEGAQRALIEASAIASRVVTLVNPNGTTDIDDVAEAENGAVIDGDVNDVHTLQAEKFNDFRVTVEMAQRLEQRLSFAFLLNTAIQRNGERVTAEEIRYMAQELEGALGGVYTILSVEFQMPLVQVVMDMMTRKGVLPSLPKDIVTPQITTGLDALGRGHDLDKLNAFMAAISPLGEEEIGLRMRSGDFIKRVGTALGIDMDGLVASEEQVAQERNNRIAQELMQQLGPNVINQLGQGQQQPTAPPTQ